VDGWLSAKAKVGMTSNVLRLDDMIGSRNTDFFSELSILLTVNGLTT